MSNGASSMKGPTPESCWASESSHLLGDRTSEIRLRLFTFDRPINAK